jgi:hypothetical protein
LSLADISSTGLVIALIEAKTEGLDYKKQGSLKVLLSSKLVDTEAVLVIGLVCVSERSAGGIAVVVGLSHTGVIVWATGKLSRDGGSQAQNKQEELHGEFGCLRKLRH